MNHSEALEQMAVERYLLDEMGSDARNAFEEHLFDCTECAMDVRAGVVFIDEAKKQLPAMAAARNAKSQPVVKERRDWFAWLRPVYMAPVMAALLIVVGYQNFVEVPALQMAANEPSMALSTPLRGATRGDGDHQKLTTTANGRLAISEILPADGTEYASYVVELVNPHGKTMWSTTVAAAQADGQTLSIPGRILENGTYTLKITGVDAQGARTPMDPDVFDVTVTK